jgi:predicted nucleic acid-binding protein
VDNAGQPALDDLLGGDPGRGAAGGAFARAAGVADLLVGATAERLQLPLATLNVRHYPMFPGLEPAYRR